MTKKQERDAELARQFSEQAGLNLEHLEWDRAVLDRFWSKVEVSGDHWLWTRSRTPDGVGQFAITPSIVVKAHRFAWELLRGELEPGAVLARTPECDQAHCLNPAHHNRTTKAEAGRAHGKRGGRGNLKKRPGTVPVNCSQNVVDLLSAMHEQGRNFLEIHNLAVRFGLGVGAVQHIIKGNAVGVR